MMMILTIMNVMNYSNVGLDITANLIFMLR